MELAYLDANQYNGVLGVLSSNQINIATFVHQMGVVCVSQVVEKSSNIYLI